jgi:uncharacterized protein YhbP (UPF0306 family)
MKVRLLEGSEAHDAALVQRSALEILGGNTLCSMATVDPIDSSAYVWTAYYCLSDDMRLFVLTPPQSHHGRHLERNESTAVAVYDSRQAWDSSKRGLQLFGTAAQTKGSETSRALVLYLRRYPAVALIVKHPSELAHIDARFYAVTVGRGRLLDEGVFGRDVFVDFEIVR